MSDATSQLTKLATYIPGFDTISFGGLPKGRTTLVSGTAGGGKTVFAAQFLIGGITQANQPGVFVTFEETPDDIRQNMRSFGWDIEQFERDGTWAFVDGSYDPGVQGDVVGEYDLSGLLARVKHAVERTGAQRVAVDSLGAVFSQFTDAATVRSELFRVSLALKEMGVTSVMTAERTTEYGDIARHGIEEFVADNVVVLRNVLQSEKRRRTVEILKFRGAAHQKGEFPFTILPQNGIVAVPLSEIELTQKSSVERISSGNNVLDQMTGGGFYQDSVVLASGATGTGKTLMVSSFVAAGAKQDQRCLLFAFEESRDQLIRNARGWGLDFEQMERDGLLRIVCEYPEVSSLEDHLVRLQDEIEFYRPARVAIDSLSALERVATTKSFREFVIGITSFLKTKEIAGLFTSATPNLLGGTSITETHISSITDSIILLRYVERFGEIARGIAVLKMRGSAHDTEIREFTIDSDGMHIGKPFSQVSGILAGVPVYALDHNDQPSGSGLPNLN
jgi:circadian clock protein KaiC